MVDLDEVSYIDISVWSYFISGNLALGMGSSFFLMVVLISVVKLKKNIGFLDATFKRPTNISVNPRWTLKWPFGVQIPGTLLCDVVRVSKRNFLRLLRGTSLRL